VTEGLIGLVSELRTEVNELSGRVRAQGEVLAAMEGLTSTVHGLAETAADLQLKVELDDDPKDKGYKPQHNPRWWDLGPTEKAAEIGRIRGWLTDIASVFLGTKGFPGCVLEHDVTVLYLDAACELWKVLWLPESRSAKSVAGQCEYLGRVWPTIRAEVIRLTNGCDHQSGMAELHRLREVNGNA
jgi:hypothetical protein